MTLTFWPETFDDRSAEDGPAWKLLKRLRGDLQLFRHVEAVLQDIERSSDIRHLYATDVAKELVDVTRPIHELRIPPRRREGVVRIYFCYHPDKNDELVILDAELKKGRRKADSNKIAQAEYRYGQMFP